MKSIEQKRLEYFAFALEVFKEHKGLSGKEAYRILRETGADTYIYDLYELLHVHGNKHLINELESYFASCSESVAEAQPLWKNAN